jgi:hypothetical protein
MEVLCTQMCATASLYLGRGGCLCLILSSRTSLSFPGVLPIADPPGRQFLFHSGLWARGKELLRMELQRRKSAATDFFCSSSSSLLPSTSPTFTIFDFPMLFYSGCSPLREACMHVESIHARILRSVLFSFDLFQQIPEIILFFLGRTRHSICSEQDRMLTTKTVL